MTVSLVVRRGSRDRGFTAAFWELYLHEVHLRLGFDCSRDPVLPDSNSRPDFLMSRGEDSFYLEAKYVGYSNPEYSLQQRQEQMVEMINTAYHPDFALTILSVNPGTQNRGAAMWPLRSRSGLPRSTGRPR